MLPDQLCLSGSWADDRETVPSNMDVHCCTEHLLRVWIAVRRWSHPTSVSSCWRCSGCERSAAHPCKQCSNRSGHSSTLRCSCTSANTWKVGTFDCFTSQGACRSLQQSFPAVAGLQMACWLAAPCINSDIRTPDLRMLELPSRSTLRQWLSRLLCCVHTQISAGGWC